MNKKLYRDEQHKVLGGVCAGLAQYFDMDVTVVRLLFAFTFFIMGAGGGTYILLWIVLPRKGYNFNNFNSQTVDYTVPPQNTGDFGSQQTNNNPFASNPFNNNSFNNSSFNSDPFRDNPVDYSRPKQKTHAGVIVGLVLIFIGAVVLIENFDLIPDFDFERLWPAALVLVGAALIVSGQQNHIWPNNNVKEETQPIDADNAPTADNNTTI